MMRGLSNMPTAGRAMHRNATLSRQASSAWHVLCGQQLQHVGKAACGQRPHVDCASSLPAGP